MKYKFSLCLLSILVIIQDSKISCEDEIVVTIPQGVLRGYERLNKNGDLFYAFRSIPYAEPPINELRFMPPEPHKGWPSSTILNATEDVPICYQAGLGLEDCLYLNLYTKQQNPSTARPKPVMVFFHGGGYKDGTAREESYNPEFLLNEDIVLVTANYRVGLLGFLNLGRNSTAVTANAGMKDQTMVLKWVQENIVFFGGDANSVTIFGESAGASSVHLHMFSPLSAGLFHKVIAESGSALIPWSVGKSGSGEQLGKVLNIPDEDPEEILKKLQKIPISELSNAQETVYGKIGVVEEFFGSPIVEQDITGAFLTKHPKILIANGNHTRVPLIMGYNDKEGIFIDIINRVSGQYLDLYDLKNLIPHDLNIKEEDVPVVVKELEDFYFQGRHPVVDDDAEILIDVITDTWFLYGIYSAIEKHSFFSDSVYFYRFCADTSLNYFKNLHPVTATYKGASHGDDLGYLFKTIYTPNIVSNSIEDIKLNEMVTLWTNFAKYSDPTPDIENTILGDLKWSPIALGNPDRNYLYIGNGKLHENINPDHNRIQFWQNIYSKYGN